MYEDEDEKWHHLDGSIADYNSVVTNPNFEGTLDSKKIKFKVISVPKDGEGAVLKYGDDSDWHIEDGVHFPHVPPPLPESRLPQLVCNTKVSRILMYTIRTPYFMSRQIVSESKAKYHSSRSFSF